MDNRIIVSSKLRKITKDAGMNVASDFLQVLNEEVKQLITKAIKRAHANGRKTVQGKDL